MVNQNLVIGQRGDVPLVQELHFGIGRGVNLGSDHNIVLRPVDEDEIGMGHDIGDGYFLDPVINQEYDDEYGRVSEYEDKYVPIDQKAVKGERETLGSEGDHGAVNHDIQMAVGSSVSELRYSEDNEFDLLEDCEVDEDFEVMKQSTDMVAISSPHHSIVHPQVLSTTPIVQTRTLTPLTVKEFSVGQEFPDVKSCRRALRDLAIALHFEIQTVKSDKTRFTAKCASGGCPWRVHAAKLPGIPTFTVRTIHYEHNCGGIAHLGHQQASVEWVANSVEERLKENPHYKPKEILEDIHRAHGITLSYKQAWRGKERFMASLRGSFEEDYRLLPQYCNQIRRTNPGSIASVCVNPIDNSFQRLFISYQASIYGFLNACRPLIGLNRTVLKNKYLGTLLFATSFDGDGTLFPLAFSVVDEENDESWNWFLSELHKLLDVNTKNMPRLTILSDRHKSIVDAVELNFPTAFHGFCMLYLSESFRKEFNNPNLSELLWEAANALTVSDFDSKILDIEEVSQDAAFWIRKIPPQLWANSYFEGSRLGNLTASIVELLNSWIHDASGLPIVQMMECIRRQLMMWFEEQRNASMQWTSTLVPSAERQVSEALDFGRSYQVLRLNEDEFEVISHEGTNIVDVRSRCCSCRRWEVFGIPCSHAVAALLSCRQNVHRFVEGCFTVASFEKAYSQTIHPVPDRTMWHEGGCGEDMVVNPPKSLRPAAAQSRKRRASSGERSRTKRVMHCSRCYQTGHFRTTCAAPL